MEKKVGDAVRAGETLAVLHAASEPDAAAQAEALRACYVIGAEKPEAVPFIRGIVDPSF